MPRITSTASRGLTRIGLKQVLAPTFAFYSSYPNLTVSESGETVYISHTNLTPGSTLYWTIEHITTTSADFPSDSGSFTVLPGNLSYFSYNISADQFTEFTEEFRLQIRTGSTSGPVVLTSSIITLEDTSKTVFTGGTLPTGYRLASYAAPPVVPGAITDAEVFIATSNTDQIFPTTFTYYYSTDLTNWTAVTDVYGIGYRAGLNTLVFYNANSDDSQYGQLYLVTYAGDNSAGLTIWQSDGGGGGGFFPISESNVWPSTATARIYIGYRNEPAFLLLTTELTGRIKNSGYQSWTQINSAGFNFTASNIQANIGWAYNTDTIVAANYNDASGVRIVRSTDLGFSWDAVVDNTDWTAPGTEYVKGIAYGQGGYYALCANGADLVSTSNNGATWTAPAAVDGLRAGADNIWSVRTGSGFNEQNRVMVTYSGANNTYVSILQFVVDPGVFPPVPTLTAFELGPFATPITEIYTNGTQIFGSTPGSTIYVLDPDQAVIGPIPAEIEFTIVSADWGGAVAVASGPALLFTGPLNATSAGIIQDLVSFLDTPVAVIDVFVNDSFVSTETIFAYNSSPSVISIDTVDGWPAPFSGSNQPNGTVIRFVQVS